MYTILPLGYNYFLINHFVLLFYTFILYDITQKPNSFLIKFVEVSLDMEINFRNIKKVLANIKLELSEPLNINNINLIKLNRKKYSNY